MGSVTYRGTVPPNPLPLDPPPHMSAPPLPTCKLSMYMYILCGAIIADRASRRRVKI